MRIIANQPVFSLVYFRSSVRIQINRFKLMIGGCDGMAMLHLDAEQAGVGIVTCGPGVLPQYQVPLIGQTFDL